MFLAAGASAGLLLLSSSVRGSQRRHSLVAWWLGLPACTVWPWFSPGQGGPRKPQGAAGEDGVYSLAAHLLSGLPAARGLLFTLEPEAAGTVLPRGRGSAGSFPAGQLCLSSYE